MSFPSLVPAECCLSGAPSSLAGFPVLFLGAALLSHPRCNCQRSGASACVPHVPQSMPRPGSAPRSRPHLLHSQTSPDERTVPSPQLSAEEDGPAREHALSACFWLVSEALRARASCLVTGQ